MGSNLVLWLYDYNSLKRQLSHFYYCWWSNWNNRVIGLVICPQLILKCLSSSSFNMTNHKNLACMPVLINFMLELGKNILSLSTITDPKFHREIVSYRTKRVKWNYCNLVVYHPLSLLWRMDLILYVGFLNASWFCFRGFLMLGNQLFWQQLLVLSLILLTILSQHWCQTLGVLMVTLI